MANSIPATPLQPPITIPNTQLDDAVVFNYVQAARGLLHISSDDADAIMQLKMYLPIVLSAVLRYCNRDDIPSGLRYPIVMILADVYRQNLVLQTAASQGGAVTGNVSTITEGGRSVSFQTIDSNKAGDSSTLQGIIDSRVAGNKMLLPFKKVYYTGDLHKYD